MPDKIVKVAAVKCETYQPELLREKITQAVNAAGGFPEKIKPGAKILIKPNMLTAKSPEEATTTHPEFIRAVIKVLRDHGIADITVGDSPAGNHEWKKLWTETGIMAMAEEEQVELLPFEQVKRVETSKGRTLPVLKQLDDFDAVISLPKLKTHMLTKVTGAVKNSYGLIVGLAKSSFHGDFPSPRKMSEFVAECYRLLKPDYVLMDAILCMEGDGPSGGDPYSAGLIFAGPDGVAIDVCACGVYDYKPDEILSLKCAGESGAGINDIELIDKTGDGWDVVEATHCKHSKSDFLSKIPEPLFLLFTLIENSRPWINTDVCIKCGICAKACSQKAIEAKPGNGFKVKGRKCVLCMCCIEACPVTAIKLRAGWFWRTFIQP